MSKHDVLATRQGGNDTDAERPRLLTRDGSCEHVGARCDETATRTVAIGVIGLVLELRLCQVHAELTVASASADDTIGVTPCDGQ